MNRKIKNLFKTIDYFGVNFNFHYKTKEKYTSFSGGIVFLIYLIMALIFVLINFKALLNRENMSIISYRVYKPSTDSINFKNYSLMHAFGIKCSKFEIGKEYEYFKLSVNQVKLTQNNGIVKYDKTPINYSHCTKKHFFNKFNESIDEYGLNQRFCFDDDNLTIRGLYTDEIYQYIELTVSMTKTNEEDYDTYYNLLTTNDCTFQLYHIDYGIDINNFNNPITPYLRQEFLKLSPIDFNKMEIYYLTQRFMTDKNYFFNSYNIEYYTAYSMFTSFSLFKGNDRFKKKPDAYEQLAKFFLRADNGINVISRKYMKFTEFLANVSSLISGIYLFLFLFMGRINKFYAKERLMTKNFKFKDDKNELFIKKLKQNLPKENTEIINIKKTRTNNISQFIHKIKIKGKISNLKKSNLKKHNTTTQKESTTEEIILNSNNNLKHYLSHMEIGNNNIKSSIKKDNCYLNQKIYFKYNFCELLILVFCKFLSGRKLKLKNILFKKGEKLLFLSSDILSYLKNMQILDILTHILLEPNQINMLNFISKPVISFNKQINSKKTISWNLKDNEEKEKDINEFCKGYKELQTTIKKTKIDKKFITIINEELDDLIS
jgi:hypothetical protein